MEIKEIKLGGILDGLMLVSEKTDGGFYYYGLELIKNSDKQLNKDLLKLNSTDLRVTLYDDGYTEVDLCDYSKFVRLEYVGDNIKIYSVTGKYVNTFDTTYKILYTNNTYYLYQSNNEDADVLKLANYIVNLTDGWTMKDKRSFYISLDYLIVKDRSNYYIYSTYCNLFKDKEVEDTKTLLFLYTLEGDYISMHYLYIMDFSNNEGKSLDCIDSLTDSIITIDKITRCKVDYKNQLF